MLFSSFQFIKFFWSDHSIGDLYCLVFCRPFNKSRLTEVLSSFGCEYIAGGPTDYSLEFRVSSDNWNTYQWHSWQILLSGIEREFNESLRLDKSCFPELIQ